MSEEEALNKALIDALAAAPAVVALVGTRVFDQVPKDATWPYVEIGDMRAVPDGGGCAAGQEIFVTLTAHSKAVGQREARAIVGALRTALHEQALAMPAPFALVEGEVVAAFTRRNATNPEISEGLVSYRALVEG